MDHLIKQKKLFEKGYGHVNFAEAINEVMSMLEVFVLIKK